MHQKIFIFLVLSLFNLQAICADSDMSNRSKQSFNSIKGGFNSKEALKTGFTQPLIESNSEMSSLNGETSFNGQLSCKSSNQYLSVGLTSGTNNSVSINVSIDSNLDGNINQTQGFSNIDVVCTNGYMQCENGTEDCNIFKWNSNPSISAISMVTKEERETVYGCYCVNDQCSSGYSTNNQEQIAKSIGNGIASAMQIFNPYYTISDVKMSSNYIDFYGQDSIGCQDVTMPSLHEFKGDNNALITAGTNATGDDKYVMMEKFATSSGNSGSLESCSVNRDFTLTTTTASDVISIISGEGSLTSCGENCVDLTVGVKADNTFESGSACTIKYVKTKLNIKPENIVSATLLDSSFEDQMVIYTDTGGVISTFEGFTNTTPASSACQTNDGDTHTYGSPKDITSHFKTDDQVELSINIAATNSGSYYYKVRFNLNVTTSYLTTFKMFAQGDDYIQCDYSLVSSSVNCSTDGAFYTTELTETLNFDEVCSSVTDINRSQDMNYEPSGSWGNVDTSVTTTHIKTPNCDNGLTGTVKITDNSSSSDSSYSLSGRFHFTLTNPNCTINETINNTCLAKENICSLQNEFVDGVQTLKTMIETGLYPLPSTRTITSNSCEEKVTRPDFSKTREYLCPREDADIPLDLSRFQKPSVSDSEISINLGSGTDGITLPLPELPTHDSCVQTCEVRRAVIDTRVNLSGMPSENRTDKITYEKEYKSCEANTCPTIQGEEIIQPCGCLNEFGKAMATMQLIRLAGKDLICTE